MRCSSSSIIGKQNKHRKNHEKKRQDESNKKYSVDDVDHSLFTSSVTLNDVNMITCVNWNEIKMHVKIEKINDS